MDYQSVPWTREALKALGRLAFFRYPVQLAPALQVAIDRPDESGLPVTNGQFTSIVWAESPGGILPALTCASCHADEGVNGPVAGRTNRHFDYGALLDDYFGTPSASGTWGPGRVDVTSDGIENPTYVTDLRPVAFQNDYIAQVPSLIVRPHWQSDLRPCSSPHSARRLDRPERSFLPWWFICFHWPTICHPSR